MPAARYGADDKGKDGWKKLHKSSRSEACLSFDGQQFEDLNFDHEITIRRSPHPLTCTLSIYVVLEPGDDMVILPNWLLRLKYFLGWNEKFHAP